MRWRKCDLWKAAIVVGGVLFLVFMTLVMVPVAEAHEGVAGAYSARMVVVQATPTVDATVTALQKQQLTLQNKQLQQSEDRGFDAWLWNNAAAIVASFLSTLVVVIGALIGFTQWRTNRNDIRTKEANDRKEAQDKELLDRQAERERREEEQRRWLEDQKAEREKRAEERFQAVCIGLGGEREEAKAGAAIVLRTFLRPGYEEFYTQTFDLAVAHLRLRHDSVATSKSLNSLSRALITVFKESYPKARQLLEGGRESKFEPPFLDASRICLDGAYLFASDLNNIWMPEASLIDVRLGQAKLQEAYLRRTVFRKTVLWEADLREADIALADFSGADIRYADLAKADLRGAKLNGAMLTNANLRGARLGIITILGVSSSTANPEEAQSLEGTDLRGVTGLTQEQLTACKAKGAIVDEDITTDSPKSNVAPASLPQPSS